jgi:transcriptional regulator with XRE-family HTH domain
MGGSPPREPAAESNSSVSDDLRKVFGQNTRAARIKAGLTQAQLAERTGLTQQYVSLVEADHQNITIDTMAAIARVIGRDVSALIWEGRNRIGEDYMFRVPWVLQNAQPLAEPVPYTK